jgi:hypothetical protein
MASLMDQSFGHFCDYNGPSVHVFYFVILLDFDSKIPINLLKPQLTIVTAKLLVFCNYFRLICPRFQLLDTVSIP